MMAIDQCLECGEPILNQVAQICEKCLIKRYCRLRLEDERCAWAASLPQDIALSANSRKVGHAVHLVLIVDPRFTYCGQRAMQPKKQRQRVAWASLPPDVCPDCVLTMERIRLTAS
jgi:hypothetical protein